MISAEHREILAVAFMQGFWDRRYGRPVQEDDDVPEAFAEPLANAFNEFAAHHEDTLTGLLLADDLPGALKLCHAAGGECAERWPNP